VTGTALPMFSTTTRQPVYGYHKLRQSSRNSHMLRPVE